MRRAPLDSQKSATASQRPSRGHPMKELQKLMSRVRSAAEKYNMIEDGDRIAVGISGGKDSLALLCALSEMRRYYPAKYELHAITLDMGFDLCQKIGAPPADFSEIAELCRRLHVPYTVKKTEIAHIIFDIREESNPCSLCARMRRGCLHDLTLEAGCNKLALGHHYNDASVTVLLNLLYGGRVGCFSPVTTLTRKNITVIRPMIMCEESEIKCFQKHAALPVIKSPCPEDRESERAAMKSFIREFDQKCRGLDARIVGAIERAGIDGWKS